MTVCWSFYIEELKNIKSTLSLSGMVKTICSKIEQIDRFSSITEEILQKVFKCRSINITRYKLEFLMEQFFQPQSLLNGKLYEKSKSFIGIGGNAVLKKCFYFGKPAILKITRT